ncbi:MAG: flippase-like domain-containing protein [Corallococcus sp.]|nr:flippase-like domain-containing protein [Corallococcus sp.]
MHDKDLEQNTAESQQTDLNVENIDETPVASDSSEQTGAKPVRKLRIDYDEALKNFDNKEIAAPKKKKHGWIGTLFLFVIIGVGIWLMVEMASKMDEDGIKSFDKVIADADWVFALITLGVLLVIIITDSLKYSIVMKTIDGKYRLKTSIKTGLLGKYYDGITPFSTGGQPMQIYYLHKKGLSGGKASAVVFIKFFANMFAWLIVSSLCMIVNSGVLGRYNTGIGTDVLKIGGWIGWAGNAILPIFIIMFVLIPKFSYKLASGVIWLGWKLRIVKDKEKTLKKAFGVVNDFRSSFAIMSKHPFRFFTLFLCCFIEVAALFAFPYFVLRMFSGLKAADGINVLFDVMTLNVYANFSVAIIPTPGNSGFLENMMTIAFSGISGNVLFWFVLVWRFLTYYMYILIGIGITVFELIRNFVRAKRAKNKEAADIQSNGSQ